MSTQVFQPKAILFDLLTALLDSWTLWNECAGSEERGRKWRAQYLDSTFSCGSYKPYIDMVRQASIDSGVGVECADRLFLNWDRLQAWPEVKDVLGRLKAKGYRLGVVTNCSAELGSRAAVCVGVDFDMVTTAEDIGYVNYSARGSHVHHFYKPVPQVYTQAVEELGCALDEVLFVAGSSGDVGGAESAGLAVVWHNHVGLTAKSASVPLREGKTLNEALQDFL